MDAMRDKKPARRRARKPRPGRTLAVWRGGKPTCFECGGEMVHEGKPTWQNRMVCLGCGREATV
jgi:hypothetical protein